MKANIILIIVAGILIGSVDGATIGYWRFEEGTAGQVASGAGTVLDSSTSSDHGTPVGDPEYSGDVFIATIPQNALPNALSLEFDGSGDTVSMSPTVPLGSSAAFTVEFWMRSAGSGPDLALLVDQSHGFVDSTGWAFQSDPGSGVINFALGNGGAGAGNFTSVSSSSDLFDDTWHHLAGTFDGTEMEFFVDGVSQGTQTTSFVSNTRDFRVGSTHVNTRHFTGLIDELRISDVNLPESQFLSAIPEPSTSILLMLASLGIVFVRSR